MKGAKKPCEVDFLDVSRAHPLSLELASLKESLAQYQHTAHALSVQLQRAALEKLNAQNEVHILQQTNVFLEREVKLLHTQVERPSQQPSQIHSDLSLTLLRAQEKTKFLEEALSEHIRNHVASRSIRDSLILKVDSLENSLSNAHFREESALQRITVLERETRQACIEKEMADLALTEYADLVRKLEGRTATSNEFCSLPLTSHAEVNPTIQSLTDAHAGLRRLLVDSHQEVDKLHAEIKNLHVTMEKLQANLQAKQGEEQAYQRQITALESRLGLYEAEDGSASQMVEKYMSFSQASTQALQASLELVKSRHSASQNTLHHKIETLELALKGERVLHDSLRQRFDVVAEEISRASFERRREASLRLKLIAREECLAEGLRRIICKLEEAVSSHSIGSLNADGDHTLRNILRMALALQGSLDGPGSLESSDGSLGRLILAHNTLNEVLSELERESERRLVLENQFPVSTQRESSSGVRCLEDQILALLLKGSITAPGEASGSSTDATIKEHSLQPGETVDFPAHLTPGHVPTYGFTQNHYGQPTLPACAVVERVLDKHQQLRQQFRDCRTGVVTVLEQIEGAVEPAMSYHGGFRETAFRFLSKVGARLSDIIEDVLVEIEIRVSDDMRSIQGFQTLLNLTKEPEFPSPQGHSFAEIQEDFQKFTNEASSPSRPYNKALEQKLGDIQHDLAVLKLIFHETSTPSLMTNHLSDSSRWDAFISSLSFRLGMVPIKTQDTNSPTVSYGTQRILDHSRISGILGLRSVTRRDKFSGITLEVTPRGSIEGGVDVE
ncbi:uncharacterized protein EI90DRAFT_3119084 [Cantharellus anzutake]|uniref:uncharacterized protein n=1 Tax=Cantharellus anzutake TaxID=1750568 RepID=UPI001906EE10|nr:uncharacterized protein EI90DRAFT_3119084 [Cantharellus anzutake]KAF8337639.1 hypothetical protein EI90DRAFT_3119084 [Cantharellus anzutake]